MSESLIITIFDQGHEIRAVIHMERAVSAVLRRIQARDREVKITVNEETVLEIAEAHPPVRAERGCAEMHA
jgi:hypothetical protein